MIWFDLKKLESKISKNQLSNKDGFVYLLAFFILSELSAYGAMNETSLWVKIVSCIIMVLITIWGLIALYKVNEEVDGKDFFKRFFAITWVVGFRLFVITLGIGLILTLIVGIINPDDAEKTLEESIEQESLFRDIFLLAITTFFGVLFYALSINSFRRLKQKPGTRN